MLINKEDLSFKYFNIYGLINEKFGFPIFQRFYNWKDKQVVELLNDIDKVFLNPNKEIYYLDFIVYQEEEKLKIADGQQRLVTLNVLLKVINDLIEREKLEIPSIELFDLTYDNHVYNKKYQGSFNNYMQAPFRKIYLFLQDYVVQNRQKLEELISIIKTKIWIYIKTTSDSDDAFTIFTQINTGGKPLSKDEVIKTAIDQYSNIYDIPVKYTMKNLKKTISGYYKFLYSANNNNFDTIAIMGFLKNDVVKSKESFREFVNFLNVVTNVDSYSISYIITYINRSQLFDIINVMAIKEIDFNKKKEYLRFVMFPLSLLSIVMTMKKANPGGIIRTLYSKVIEMLKEDQKPKVISEQIASFINENSEICKIGYEDFIVALGKKELSSRVKQALLLIEVMLDNESGEINIPSINLEHIYPQKPDPEWAIHNWPTDTEGKAVLIHNIGNFMLLNEAINKKIKNKYIDKKIDEYSRIVPRDKLLNTKMNNVDFSRFEKEKGEYIYYRQRLIAEVVYDVFPLGQVIVVK